MRKSFTKRYQVLTPFACVLRMTRRKACKREIFSKSSQRKIPQWASVAWISSVDSHGRIPQIPSSPHKRKSHKFFIPFSDWKLKLEKKAEEKSWFFHLLPFKSKIYFPLECCERKDEPRIIQKKKEKSLIETTIRPASHNKKRREEPHRKIRSVWNFRSFNIREQKRSLEKISKSSLLRLFVRRVEKNRYYIKGNKGKVFFPVKVSWCGEKSKKGEFWVKNEGALWIKGSSTRPKESLKR